MNPPSNRFAIAGLVLAEIGLAAVLSIGLRRPWTGSFDYDGAIWSQAAHNNLRAGLGRTLGVASSWHFGPLPIPPQGFYTHHPPGLPLLVTGSFAMFGETEAAARLVPIVHTLAGVALLWLLVRGSAGARAATLAAMALAVLPMQMYVGRMVHVDTCAMTWSLAALLGLEAWRRTGKRAALAAAFACFLVAMWFSWFAYVLVAAVSALLFVSGQGRLRRVGIALTVLAVVSFGLFLFHIRLVRPDAWQELLRAYDFRSGGEAVRGGPAFGWSEWLRKQVEVSWSLIGPGAWLAALAGAALALHPRAAPGVRAVGRVAASFALATAVYLVAFRNGSFIHSFWGSDSVVPVALLSALSLDAALGWSERRGRAAAIAARAGVAMFLAFLAAWGYAETRSLHAYQYRTLERGFTEPPDLIPALGRLLGRTFPEEAYVLSNLPHRGTQVRYYAQRRITYELKTPADWSAAIARRGARAAGLVWLDGPGATEIVAALPAGAREEVRIGEVRFLLWRPAEPGDREEHSSYSKRESLN